MKRSREKRCARSLHKRLESEKNCVLQNCVPQNDVLQNDELQNDELQNDALQNDALQPRTKRRDAAAIDKVNAQCAENCELGFAAVRPLRPMSCDYDNSPFYQR